MSAKLVQLEAAVGSLSIPESELWFIVGEKGQKYPGPGKIHALCGPVGGDYEAESIADALVFAASRELLAALKDAVNGKAGWIERADAAIAKAEPSK